MQLSHETLFVLADGGDTEAQHTLKEVNSYILPFGVEVFYQASEAVFILHSPTRSRTMMGMPAITPSDIIIQDNDGGCDDDE